MENQRFSQLLERVRRGEDAAVQELVAEYQDAIRREVRFALLDSRLRRIVSESDVLQSVLMRFCIGLWAGNLEVDSPEQLVGLLKTMVRSRVVDWVRYTRAQRRDVRRDAYLEPEIQALQPSDQETPSKIVADQELVARVRAQLSPAELQILELRQEQFTWAQIAEKLHAASPDAVRKKYERALEQVFHSLEQD